MRVLISAGEASADIHGANLLKALKKIFAQQFPDQTLEAFGIGGPKLREAGLDTVVDNSELMAMGIGEVIARLPRILRAMDTILEAAENRKPDFAIVIDYPDFHFRLAKKLKNRLGIPVLYYIAPKVWVWRSGRLKKMRRLFSKVLCILPFEEEIYHRARIPVKYVGNPILDELPLDLTRQAARQFFQLQDQQKTLALLPGSRPGELKRHFYLFLNSAQAAALELRRMGKLALHEKLVCLMALPEGTDNFEYVSRLQDYEMDIEAKGQPLALDLRLAIGHSAHVLKAADAGLVKSGTITLEAGLLGLPHVIVYKANPLTEFIFKYFVAYDGPVGLVNLATGWRPGQPYRFEELLMNQVTLSNLKTAIIQLLTDEPYRNRLAETVVELRRAILQDWQEGDTHFTRPSLLAAEEVLSFYHHLNTPQTVQEKGVRSWFSFMAPLGRFFGSSLWSFINGMRRWLLNHGFLKAIQLPSRVISVGNIQAGGSGKTPLVAEIAREAYQRGKTVCILTRGYRSRWEIKGGIIAPGDSTPPIQDCGDEAALLHELAPHAWIGVGRIRALQFKRVVEKLGRPIDITIIDDGFQNWRIKKNVELVTVTSSKRDERLFREWANALVHADLVIWTKGKVKPKDFGRPLVKVDYNVSKESIHQGPVWLVTGVGDAEHAAEGARLAGFDLQKHFEFPDHARYNKNFVAELMEDADAVNTRIALTGKDWVKWREMISAEQQSKIVVLEPQLHFDPEGQQLWEKTLWGS